MFSWVGINQKDFLEPYDESLSVIDDFTLYANWIKEGDKVNMVPSPKTILQLVVRVIPILQLQSPINLEGRYLI